MSAAASQTCFLRHNGNGNTEFPQSAAETATPTNTPRHAPTQSKISSCSSLHLANQADGCLHWQLVQPPGQLS